MLDKLIADVVKKIIINALKKIYIRVSLFGSEVGSVKLDIYELPDKSAIEVKLFIEKS